MFVMTLSLAWASMAALIYFLNVLQDGCNIDEDREDEYYILDNAI